MDKTWSDDVCGKKIEMIMPITGGLYGCKTKCDMNKECTAIEHSNAANGVKCCILRRCPVPVPIPNVTQAGWHGGEFKYLGYVKGNCAVTQLCSSGKLYHITIQKDNCLPFIFFFAGQIRQNQLLRLSQDHQLHLLQQ